MGRVVEFLVVGGATLFLFPLAWLLRHVFGLDDAELAVGFLTFYGAYVINDPHFAVSYLLFYRGLRKRAAQSSLAQRARYVIAGFITPIGLVSWGVVALVRHSAEGIGWMVQLMFLLVGWHYVKQGFGVLTVLSSRHGVTITARERLAVLAHCYVGWAFAWANPSVPAGEFEEKGVVYHALAHPRWLELLTGSLLALSTIAMAVVLLTEGRRRGRFVPVAPLLGLLVTVWAWTIFSSVDPLLRYAIPALHSLQYLYFVWLMRRNEARASEGPPTFGRPARVRLAFLAIGALALGFALFHGIPGWLDAMLVPRTRASGGHEPGPLGETPFFAVFFVIVSVHHYLMDYAIWRRENPDTRFLRAA